MRIPLKAVLRELDRRNISFSKDFKNEPTPKSVRGLNKWSISQYNTIQKLRENHKKNYHWIRELVGESDKRALDMFFDKIGKNLKDASNTYYYIYAITKNALDENFKK